MYSTMCIQDQIEKLNKKRTVTVRRVIIFLNISRHPLPLLFTLLSSSVKKNSEGGGNGDSGVSCGDPPRNLNEVFWGVSSGLPLV